MSYKEMLTTNRSDTQNKETNDCGVYAVAQSCRVTYDEAHEALKRAGRKDRQGTYPGQSENAIGILGMDVRKISVSEFFETCYPSKFMHTKLTTYLPRMFPERCEWMKGRTFLFRVDRHVLAVVDGEVQDWSASRWKYVHTILEVKAPEDNWKEIGPDNPDDAVEKIERLQALADNLVEEHYEVTSLKLCKGISEADTDNKVRILYSKYAHHYIEHVMHKGLEPDAKAEIWVWLAAEWKRLKIKNMKNLWGEFLWEGEWNYLTEYEQQLHFLF